MGCRSGRDRVGVASPATSSTIIMSSTWGLGRASWQGTQGLPQSFRRPLWPSWRVGFAAIPTKSGASRASGWILGSWSRRRPGPATASRSLQQSGELVDQLQVLCSWPCRPGPASAASRSLQKIVGGIVGAASRTGREHLQGSSPPDLHLKPDSGSFC